MWVRMFEVKKKVDSPPALEPSQEPSLVDSSAQEEKYYMSHCKERLVTSRLGTRKC
jgi:hypothetical protein